MLRTGIFFKNLIWNPLKISVRHYPYEEKFLHILQNLPTQQYASLANGLNIVTEERETRNTGIALVIDGGSRYENDFENGITHFLEHVAFKATFTRSKKVLEDHMASTGAQFRCFTTREMVAYYVQCLNECVPLCIEIIADCLFNNAFCEADVEEQRRVVYNEMSDHDCDLNGLLDDYLHQTAYQGTPLGNTIMGPSSNLHNYTGTVIARYLYRVFGSDRMVLSVVGGIKHEQIVSLAECNFSKVESSKCMEIEPYRFTGSEIRFRDDSHPLGMVAIAVEGPSYCNPDNTTMEVARELVSGWDRSQPGGESHAYVVGRGSSVSKLCDAYQAFNINYKDSGLWGVKFLTHVMALDDMSALVQEEWLNLCIHVTYYELEKARRFLKIKHLSRRESCLKTALDLGRQTLFMGRAQTIEDVICSIDHVTPEDVRETVSKYVYDRDPAVVALGCIEGLLDYTRIKAYLHWLRM